MSSILGWALAAAAVAVGWKMYGWQGVLLAVSVTVFWLLLQFSRALRAMKLAGQAPVGHVPSAVMLNARLQRGMTMVKVIGLTRSLGTKLDQPGDLWRWHDDGGSQVTLTFTAGKLRTWVLHRPPEPAPPQATQPQAAA